MTKKSPPNFHVVFTISLINVGAQVCLITFEPHCTAGRNELSAQGQADLVQHAIPMQLREETSRLATHSAFDSILHLRFGPTFSMQQCASCDMYAEPAARAHDIPSLVESTTYPSLSLSHHSFTSCTSLDVVSFWLFVPELRTLRLLSRKRAIDDLYLHPHYQ